jgi:anaerobic magnesium-protoporphyrin IX monomethyl ester cyclase
MKIVICTTPIRPMPTLFPPFGSMSIINALQKAGYDPTFYDIDGLRPSFEETEEHFRRLQPDMLGISAVVSTAYAFTKKLVRMVKRVSPRTRIVLGGNLAASAEILHRLAGVDICVIGEGEIPVVNLTRALEGMGDGPLDAAVLERIPGISFLRPGPDAEMVFTGYELRLPADEVFRPDFGLLEKYSRIGNFIKSPELRTEYQHDPRTFEPHRKGKMVTTLVTEKGCVARCTFCHRWDKGFRPIPVDQIIAHVKDLIARYNVGFIMFGDENFGSDKRQTEEFLAKIKPLDILWCAGGVRVRSVNLDLLKRMKDAGCVSIFYGMETGSPKILEVMEKKATLQDNINAVKWTREAGLFTIYQMIIGMPGEDETTIAETIAFLKMATQDEIASPRSMMSLNYIQALPGTPVYEYARHKGLIGKSLADEEKYLIEISNIDAADDTKMPNYTEVDYLTLRSWRRRIVMEVMRHYHKHNKTQVPSFFSFLWRLATNRINKTANHYSRDPVEIRKTVIAEYNKGGYFNLQRDLSYDAIVAYFYPVRSLILAAWLVQNEFRRLPLGEFVGHVRDWVRCRLSPPKNDAVAAESLRALMARLAPPALTPSAKAMQPLREGR